MLTITATGIASAQRIGETVVTIRNGNLRGSLEVLVLPPGTYRVAGMVKEAGVPVAGASVDVVENADIHTLTDASGSYRLYGVAGDVQMRVTKEGYRARVSRLTVTANESLDFTLERVSPPANLAGIYTLLLAAGPCVYGETIGVPDDERTRRYDAVVTQDGPGLKVQLSGAQFATRGDRGDGFKGWIYPIASRSSSAAGMITSTQGSTTTLSRSWPRTLQSFLRFRGRCPRPLQRRAYPALSTAPSRL